MLYSILIVLQVLIAAALIGLILVQQGKGADMGAAFGSGASGTVFGSRGSGSFMGRATTTLAVMFFVNSLLLATPAVTGLLERNVEDPFASALEEQTTQSEAAADLPSVAPDLPDLPPKPGDVLPESGDLPPMSGDDVQPEGQ